MEDMERTVVLHDDEGNSMAFNILDIVDYQEKQYAVLAMRDDNFDGGLDIVQVESKEEEEIYSPVDDMATIHIAWDNGSILGAVYGVDIIRKL